MLPPSQKPCDDVEVVLVVVVVDVVFVTVAVTESDEVSVAETKVIEEAEVVGGQPRSSHSQHHSCFSADHPHCAFSSPAWQLYNGHPSCSLAQHQ